MAGDVAAFNQGELHRGLVGVPCHQWDISYDDGTGTYRIQVKRGGRSLDLDTCTNTLRADRPGVDLLAGRLPEMEAHPALNEAIGPAAC